MTKRIDYVSPYLDSLNMPARADFGAALAELVRVAQEKAWHQGYSAGMRDAHKIVSASNNGRAEPEQEPCPYDNSERDFEADYCPRCNHPWGYHVPERGCSMPLNAAGVPKAYGESSRPCGCQEKEWRRV